jgi:hypothetical protein
MARLWPASLVAAAVLVGAVSWAIFGGKSDQQMVAAAPPDPMLEKVVKAKVELDRADTNPKRLEVLDQLAKDIHSQAGETSQVTSVNDMDLLAAMYDKVVTQSLVATARSLTEDEKKAFLPRYTESLNAAQAEASERAGKAAPGRDVALRNIAKTAGEGKEQLARMLQGGRS